MSADLDDWSQFDKALDKGDRVLRLITGEGARTNVGGRP